jgi:hypothetical protein
MAEAWPPSVGARVRPVETAQVAFSPEGDPVPLPGEGPTWARLRYAFPSDGNDRREALVADVEEGEAESGGDARARHARASLVWNDGSEEDGVPLAFLGPAPVDDERSATEARADVVVSRNERERNVESAVTEADLSETRAAAASARGAFRFRRGEFAVAAAEYVEACAWLLSAVPREHVALVLPGDEKDWTLPPLTFSSFEEPSPPRVGVGARVRVSGSDGASRLALVACVDSDDETCDVLFETASDGDDAEDEEDAVAFSRLRGASLVGFGVFDDETNEDEEKQKTTSRALETLVSVTLADALLNVARCHLRLASEASETSLGGGDAAAAAADAAAAASTSLRASTAAFFLRGKARGARRRFDDAARDLETALRLATNRLARRRASASTSSTDVDGLERDIAAIGAALRDTRAAAKARRRADRRLAAAILGHVQNEGVDLGLDPESDLARYGGARSARGFGRKEKDGSVPLGEVARVVGERVAGKRCVVS